MARTEREFINLLSADRGNPEFVNYAAILLKSGRDREALDVCLAGLSANPSCHSGRLVLARVFYRLNYVPFAIREVSQLVREVPGSQSLKRLLEKISGVAVAAVVSQNVDEPVTVAETEFDIDAIEGIETDEDSGKLH